MWRRCPMNSFQNVRDIIILLGTKNEGTTVLQNVGNYMCNKTVPHPTRIRSSRSMQALSQKLKIMEGVSLFAGLSYIWLNMIYTMCTTYLWGTLIISMTNLRKTTVHVDLSARVDYLCCVKVADLRHTSSWIHCHLNTRTITTGTIH